MYVVMIINNTILDNEFELENLIWMLEFQESTSLMLCHLIRTYE